MKRLEPRLFPLAAALLTTTVALAFYVPGFARTGGHFPVPLDDVYIHFGFARAAALGHPFAWIPGNGYSSGGTSLTYPLLLAPGWLLGFRGERLAVFAALLAVACVVDLCRSLKTVLASIGAPRWVPWAASALVLSIPLLDWSLFSGMETALFAALLGRAVRASRAASVAEPSSRARAQLRLGLAAALLVATRPESAPLALLFGLVAAYDARSLALSASLARATGPTLIFLAGQAATNRALTGEWSAAGAVRKLVSSNPYAMPLESAIEVIKNLVALRLSAFGTALGGPGASWILPVLGVAALASPGTRRLAIPLLGGAWAAILLVALNSTARYQNFRYAAPSLLMLLVAAAIGAGSLARLRPRALAGSVAAVAMLVAAVAPASWFPRQIDHFARSSANIEGQQVEVARRLAMRVPRPRRVLVGDAGAIPYLSGLDAIDGLGLGGYHDLPFARASVHGVPAVVELLERLPVSERPDVLALYPSWWVGLADAFGRRAFGVRIHDNIMCAADEKVVYDADWSALAAPGETRAFAVDEIDTADLVDERAHGYQISAPHGGWVIGAVLAGADGRPRFDAGRIVPEAKHESFVVKAGVARERAELVLRTDGGEGLLRVELERDGRTVQAADISLPARATERWIELRVPLATVGGGDRVSFFAVRGAYRGFHSWLVRE